MAILALFASNTFAATAAEVEAGKLFKKSVDSSKVSQIANFAMDVYIKNDARLLPFKGVMRGLLTKLIVVDDSIKRQYVSIYTDNYSEDELRAINQFYATEIGQKMIRLNPSLVEKFYDVWARRFQELKPRIEQIINGEIEGYEIEEVIKEEPAASDEMLLHERLQPIQKPQNNALKQLPEKKYACRCYHNIFTIQKNDEPRF